jgi:hypothetical protein
MKSKLVYHSGDVDPEKEEIRHSARMDTRYYSVTVHCVRGMEDCPSLVISFFSEEILVLCPLRTEVKTIKKKNRRGKQIAAGLTSSNEVLSTISKAGSFAVQSSTLLRSDV